MTYFDTVERMLSPIYVLKACLNEGILLKCVLNKILFNDRCSLVGIS